MATFSWPHAHCHALVSLGLFHPDGVFCPIDDIDFSRIQELFRERFFQLMVRRGKISPETVDNMKGWPRSGFHLDFQRKIEADDRKGLEPVPEAAENTWT